MPRSDKPAEPKPRKARKVLVVEDSPVNLQLAVMQLDNLGYASDAARNGREALERLAQSEYDIILMDCQMPEMDGFEATWQIRNREKEQSKKSGAVRAVQIVAMTADAAEDSREKCLAAGMNDFIRKPVQLNELEAALERAAAALTGGPVEEVLDPLVLAGLRMLRRPGRPDPVVELVGMFGEEAPQCLSAIEQAVKTNDMWSMSKVVAAATSLKGSSSNLGARELSALCARMEEAGRDGALDEVSELLGRAREELDRVQAALGKIE